MFWLWGHGTRLAGTGFSLSATYEIISNMHLYTTCERKIVCFKKRWKTLSAFSLPAVSFGCAKMLRVSALLLTQVKPEIPASPWLYAVSATEKNREYLGFCCKLPRQIVKKAITFVTGLLVLHHSLPRAMCFLSLSSTKGNFLVPAETRRVTVSTGNTLSFPYLPASACLKMHFA